MDDLGPRTDQLMFCEFVLSPKIEVKDYSTKQIKLNNKAFIISKTTFKGYILFNLEGSAEGVFRLTFLSSIFSTTVFLGFKISAIIFLYDFDVFGILTI